MPQRILVDAGPLVAYLWPKDQFHRWAITQFRRFASFVTCDAVLAEACARLAYFGLDQTVVIELLRRRALYVEFDSNAASDRLATLMHRYRDRPMDFADACLVWMTEQVPDCLLVTVDHSDFTIYRRHDRHIIPFVSPRS